MCYLTHTITRGRDGRAPCASKARDRRDRRVDRVVGPFAGHNARGHTDRADRHSEAQSWDGVVTSGHPESTSTLTSSHPQVKRREFVVRRLEEQLHTMGNGYPEEDCRRGNSMGHHHRPGVHENPEYPRTLDCTRGKQMPPDLRRAISLACALQNADGQVPCRLAACPSFRIGPTLYSPAPDTTPSSATPASNAVITPILHPAGPLGSAPPGPRGSARACTPSWC